MKKFLAKVEHFMQNLTKKVWGFVSKPFKKIEWGKVFTLVKMQIKDKWNFSFKSDKKGTLLRLSGKLIVFVVITFIVYFMMNMTTTTLHIFFSLHIPFSAMIPILAVLIFFEIVSILIGMTRSLFFGKDNQVLITYPVNSGYLFISKVIVYYLDAIKKSFMLFFPVIISFGIIYGYPVYFYLLALLIDLIFVLVLTLVCGLLSIPTYYVLKFIDKFQIVKIILAVAFVGLLIYGTILLVSVIPANINLTKDYDKFTLGLNSFLNWFASTFKISTLLAHVFLGEKIFTSMNPITTYTWAGPLVGLGVAVVLIVANALLANPFYNKMIATTNRSSNKKPREHKNHRQNKFASVFWYELLRVIRNEKMIVATVVCVTIMPLITLITNKMYLSFDTDNSGISLIFMFNYLFILLVVCSHNTSSSYIYSKDGPSWTVNKTLPVNPRVSLMLRLVYNVFISVLIILPSSILFFKLFGSKITYNFPLFFLTIFTFGLFHNVASASFDYSNSKNKEKADIGSEIITTHELVSVAYALLICGLVVIALLLFRTTGTSNPQFRLFLIALFMFVVATASFLRKIRLTYQEN